MFMRDNNLFSITMIMLGSLVFVVFIAMSPISMRGEFEDYTKARDTTATMLDEDYGLELTRTNSRSLSQERITPVEVLHGQHHYSDIYAVRYDNDTDTATLIMTHSETDIPAPTPEQLREQVGNP